MVVTVLTIITLAGSAVATSMVFGSVNGGAGADTLNFGSTLNTVLVGTALGTIAGGAGSDLLIFNNSANAAANSTVANSTISQFSVNAVIAGGSGDTVRIANLSNGGVAAATGLTAANWNTTTSVASIWVASTSPPFPSRCLSLVRLRYC